MISLRLPQLNRFRVEEIVCYSGDGLPRDICRLGGRYQVNAIGLKGQVTDLEFYIYCQDQLPLSPNRNKIQTERRSYGLSERKRTISLSPFTRDTGNGQQKHELAQCRRQEINDLRNLYFSRLKNKRILTFGNPNCWARGLGLINKAYQLKEQIGMELHHYYNLVTGQGYGAIPAAAIAAGVDLSSLMHWWTEEFKKVHTPSFFNSVARTVVKFLNPAESGFNHKKAASALQKLYSKQSNPIRLCDLQTDLQFKVVFADLKIGTYSSSDEAQQDLTLAEIVVDAAITRNDFNSKSTIKCEPPFLGELEKNDLLGFLVSPEGDETEITCIDTPVRIDPENAPKLEKQGDIAFKFARQSLGQHVHQMRVRQVVEKLEGQGQTIKLLQLPCRSMDHIVRNSTTPIAQKTGIGSGAGKIELPEWFEQTLVKRIVE